jgi:hypothetical protein
MRISVTVEQFVSEMERIGENADSDPEKAHRDADALISRVMVECGYEEGMKLFDTMKKWYA